MAYPRRAGEGPLRAQAALGEAGTPEAGERIGPRPNAAQAPGLRKRPGGKSSVLDAQAKATGRLSMMAKVFLFSCFIPLLFTVGGIALTPARAVMLILFFPVLIMFFSGRAGRLFLADWLILAFSGWLSLAILALHGFAQIQFIGITVIETLVPYMVARCAIRNQTQYTLFLKFIFLISIVIVIAAAVESLTGFQAINRLLDPLGQTFQPLPDKYERRLGMVRALAVFPHPILFGIVMSLFFAPWYYMLRQNGKTGGMKYGLLSVIGTFFSLSVGAWLSVATQVGLMIWNHVLRKKIWRWKLLITLLVIGYIAIDLVSNRTPFEVVISRLTLNSGTSYFRTLIFEYGIQNVWAKPLFGVGLNEWERPAWMGTLTVDNFWLVLALRYGVPGVLLFFGFYFAIGMRVGRAKISDPQLAFQRNAFVYVLVGIFLSLCTVHIWGAPTYLLSFMLGAGVWFGDQNASNIAGNAPAESGKASKPLRPTKRKLPSNAGRKLP